MDSRSPINWVRDIKVPVLSRGAWQDEQTGGGFASMLATLPRRRDVKINLLNGVHASPLEPSRCCGTGSPSSRSTSPGAFPNRRRLAPIGPVVLPADPRRPGRRRRRCPPNRFVGITELAAARALFESDPRVRVLMENGAGSPTPGLPAPTFELGFSQVAGAEA